MLKYPSFDKTWTTLLTCIVIRINYQVPHNEMSLIFQYATSWRRLKILSMSSLNLFEV